MERRDDHAMLDFVLSQLIDPDAFLKKVQSLYGSDAVDMDTLAFRDGRLFERHSFPMIMDGVKIGRVWSFRDITERKRAEKVLRDEQKRMSTILDTVGDPIFVKDNDLRFVLANRAFYDMLGLQQDAVIGSTLAKNLPADEMRHFLEIDRRVLDTGIPDLQEESLTVRDGLTLNILTRKARFIDDSGKAFVVGAIHNITESKRTENALRLKNLVFDASLAANSIANAAGVITEANDMFLRVWGYQDRNEVIGKSILHFINDPNGAATIIKALDAIGEWTGEFTAKRKDGSTFDAQSIATTVRDETGTTIGYQSSVMDITEHKQAEAALRKSHSELEDKVKERTSRLRVLAEELMQVEHRERKRIAYVLHEDLQQNLAAIKIKVSELRQDLPDEAMCRTADRTLELLDTSIALTRGLCIDLRPPVLYELGLAAALEWLGGDMEEKLGLVIDVKADKASDFATDDMRTFAFTAVRELVMNVYKHAGVKDASICVNPPSAGRIVIEVQDKGVGFNVQLEQAEKFGLFSIRERAIALGGSLDVVGHPGGGTCATLTLPAR
jgi:PAS domain S-box-containing protein